MPRPGEAARQLFFPDPEEFEGEEPNKKGNWYGITPDQFDATGDSDEVNWPKLAKAHNYAGLEYTYRRPGFLTLLSDNEYCAVFERLASRGTANQLALPSITLFHQECKKHGPQVKQLLLHVLYWFDPSWRMPRTSAKDLENFQFPAKIKQCVTSKKVRVNIENPELRFIDGLMAHMKEHYAEWTNSSVKEWVCITRSTPPRGSLWARMVC